MRNRYMKCYSNCPNINNCDNNQNIMETNCNNISNTSKYNDNCSCGFDDTSNVDIFPQQAMLAQSYVPIQIMDETFKPCNGLDNGTIFPELVSPYCAGDDMALDHYIEQTKTIGKGCNA